MLLFWWRLWFWYSLVAKKKETISMPFDVADVNNIEMYRNVVPNSAEKQVITKTDDIEDIYFLFSGLEVSDKKTEPVAGGTVTSFRFNLSMIQVMRLSTVQKQ